MDLGAWWYSPAEAVALLVEQEPEAPPTIVQMALTAALEHGLALTATAGHGLALAATADHELELEAEIA